MTKRRWAYFSNVMHAISYAEHTMSYARFNSEITKRNFSWKFSRMFQGGDPGREKEHCRQRGSAWAKMATDTWYVYIMFLKPQAQAIPYSTYKIPTQKCLPTNCDLSQHCALCWPTIGGKHSSPRSPAQEDCRLQLNPGCDIIDSWHPDS